jgi:D-3-phosphoglycerate dehydrogenase
MSELTFGEKLILARKQLNLYQYQMAEKLGVHPNSIWKYEQGEGKPQASVVRIFEMFCAQNNITFDEFQNSNQLSSQPKGPIMKIVLAEKVSPATLAVLASERGARRRRRPGGQVGGAGDRCSPGACS